MLSQEAFLVVTIAMTIAIRVRPSHFLFLCIRQTQPQGVQDVFLEIDYTKSKATVCIVLFYYSQSHCTSMMAMWIGCVLGEIKTQMHVHISTQTHTVTAIAELEPESGLLVRRVMFFSSDDVCLSLNSLG